ncbi:MAG: hypothetical protein DMG05_12120 [Acidobacteria bacterium]|nr:MAG: hypothetical protein DMG05_12120 [Acidobacteriota bacterium]
MASYFSAENFHEITNQNGCQAIPGITSPREKFTVRSSFCVKARSNRSTENAKSAKKALEKRD